MARERPRGHPKRGLGLGVTTVELESGSTVDRTCWWLGEGGAEGGGKAKSEILWLQKLESGWCHVLS